MKEGRKKSNSEDDKVNETVWEYKERTSMHTVKTDIHKNNNKNKKKNNMNNKNNNNQLQ